MRHAPVAMRLLDAATCRRTLSRSLRGKLQKSIRQTSQFSVTSLKGQPLLISSTHTDCPALPLVQLSLHKQGFVLGESEGERESDLSVHWVCSALFSRHKTNTTRALPTCFLGAFPPVDFRAVCFVRAIASDDDRAGNRDTLVCLSTLRTCGCHMFCTELEFSRRFHTQLPQMHIVRLTQKNFYLIAVRK